MVQLFLIAVAVAIIDPLAYLVDEILSDFGRRTIYECKSLTLGMRRVMEEGFLYSISHFANDDLCELDLFS